MPLHSEWNELFRSKQRGEAINLKEPVDVTLVTDSKVIPAPKTKKAPKAKAKKEKVEG